MKQEHKKAEKERKKRSIDHMMKGRGRLQSVIATVAAVLLAAASPISIRSFNELDIRCGPCFGCKSCLDETLCCSKFGFCGSDHSGFCDVGYGCTMNCHSPTPECHPIVCNNDAAATSNTTTATAGGGWDLKEEAAAGGRSSVACSGVYQANVTFDGAMEQSSDGAGGQNHPFCRNQDATGYRSVCGNCLKVTRRRDGKQTVVRLLAGEESSSSSQLSSLGTRVFEQLLSLDGEGRRADDNQGYLAVDYQVVECDDDDGH